MLTDAPGRNILKTTEQPPRRNPPSGPQQRSPLESTGYEPTPEGRRIVFKVVEDRFGNITAFWDNPDHLSLSQMVGLINMGIFVMSKAALDGKLSPADISVPTTKKPFWQGSPPSAPASEPPSVDAPAEEGDSSE